MLYAADFLFWEQYRDEIMGSFMGELWTVSEMAREKYGTYWMRHSNGQGLSKEPDTLNGGGNSGHQAIHLAATFGATRIILLGFDMKMTGGKHHWHGKHAGNLKNGVGFPGWIKNMEYLAADLRQAGIEVLNCTRSTALRCFPECTLEEALARS